MISMNDHSSIYSWVLPLMFVIFKTKILSSFQISKGRYQLWPIFQHILPICPSLHASCGKLTCQLRACWKVSFGCWLFNNCADFSTKFTRKTQRECVYNQNLKNLIRNELKWLNLLVYEHFWSYNLWNYFFFRRIIEGNGLFSYSATSQIYRLLIVH